MQLQQGSRKAPAIALQKAGLAPTGILANAAKALGFASVDALLKVNPEAAQITQAAKETAKETAAQNAAQVACTH